MTTQIADMKVEENARVFLAEKELAIPESPEDFANN